MPHTLRRSLLASGALLFATAAIADSLAIRDQNPLARAAYLPLAAAAPGRGEGWQVDAGLLWSNTVNLGATPREQLLVDEETAELDLAIARDIGGWRLRATLPLMHRGPGVLDGFIDGWHRFFGLPQGDRPNRPRKAYAIDYRRAGLAPVTVPSGTALGDLSLEAGRVLVSSPRAELTGWIGLEAPTGDRAQLAGNGALDAAAWLALEAPVAERWTVSARAGYSHSGGDGAVPLARGIAFGTATLGWRATDHLEALLQLDGHSAIVRDSELPFLREAVALTIGGRYRLRSGAVFEAGVVEDIEVNHSPDVTFHLAWRQPVGR